jgi:predicted MFS family arabinose efflux permease
MPCAVAVSGWFNQRRGLALGLRNAGAGLGAVLAPQYARFLESRFAWRMGFVGIAIAVAMVALSGLLFLVRDPPRIRSIPTTVRSAISVSAPARASYLLDRRFWLIAVPILGATFGVMGNLVPLLTDRGISVADIAPVLSIAGISSWVGRVSVTCSTSCLLRTSSRLSSLLLF